MNLKSLYLKAYRFVGFVILTSSMAFLFGYGIMMLFFAVNSTWIAPTSLSKTSDKVLQFEGGYLSATQQQSTAKLTYDEAGRKVHLFTTQLTNLRTMRSGLDQAMKAENFAQSALINGYKQAQQSQKKTATGNISESSTIDATLKKINENLRAQLITQEEADRQRLQLQSFNNTMSNTIATGANIDYSVNRAERNITTLNGRPSSLDYISVLKALSEIDSQILQTESDLATAVQAVGLTKAQLERADQTVSALMQTPYILAKSNDVNLAFVAYDNVDAVVGTPVYDCYLMFVACRKVGTVTQIFNNEDLIDFPIFNMRLNRTVRGRYVALDLENKDSVRSTVLFVGSKPLFF